MTAGAPAAAPAERWILAPDPAPDLCFIMEGLQNGRLQGRLIYVEKDYQCFLTI